MDTSAPNQAGRIETENFLAGPCRDFSAAYMAVKYLATHIHNHPDTITTRTIDILAGVIDSKGFEGQKQVFFLYTEAAEAMVAMAACKAAPKLSEPIIPRLLSMLDDAVGKRLRALSQALGKLPISFTNQFSGCVPSQATHEIPMEISLREISKMMTEQCVTSFCWKGRSLAAASGNDVCGILKFAVSKENTRELVREIMWLERLNKDHLHPGIDLPSPLRIKNKILFKITGKIPDGAPANIIDRICIAFMPCPGYYDYPNEQPELWSSARLKSIFLKNAEYLGMLTGRGILHTALIPLFHNRVQQTRRNDNGAYLWEHGGRLDQWLDSCQYPNFAVSGPRDFEHLELSTSTEQLRHYIGEHLLGFILVIGSYFRNKSPNRRGNDKNNQPCDTRDLFHPPLFSELVDGVCRAYFKGLVPHSCPIELPLAPESLIRSLIDAMGKDEHMEEILRARDQIGMSDQEFKNFLHQRGILGDMERGKSDIVVETGPHLGGFNRPISVPELIDHLFRFSALCVAQYYSICINGSGTAENQSR